MVVGPAALRRSRYVAAPRRVKGLHRIRIEAHRDFAKRFRLQGRHTDEGKTRYFASVGTSEGLRPSEGVLPRRAAHIKMYNDVRWNYDRQRYERRVMYVDSDEDYYRQEWFHLETGEPTYFKEGKLSDPDMHGRSARRKP